MLSTLVAAATPEGEAASSSVPLGVDDGGRFSAGQFNGRSLGLLEGLSVACLIGLSEISPAFSVVTAAHIASEVAAVAATSAPAGTSPQNTRRGAPPGRSTSAMSETYPPALK